MSTLSFETNRMLGAQLNGESSLPSIVSLRNVQQRNKPELDEDDGLFVGFGYINCPFPYRMQDKYERNLIEIDFEAAILENEKLKAVFIPSLGGRLWSLYDKVKGRELTYANSVFRPANLAVRNAWFAGGVEWNCGVIGHSPYTCSQLFTAKLTLADGTPVLRMYEFERIRRATYQMDFFLPDDSPMLLCRMRIVNPNSEMVPMYWWSNIAVPEMENGRVVTPATQAFSNKNRRITKINVPEDEGLDVTYPTNTPHGRDYFWKLDENARRYVSHLNKDGYGLIQTSTSNLKGRKLFVWGQGPGGRKWQQFLSDGSEGQKYVEIQAGLAHAQYECLPMPPHTAWEWMEAYGPITADPAKVHGDWDSARKEVESKLANQLSAENLEKLLLETKETMAKKPADKVIKYGSGWGALENLRRATHNDEPISPHLDFGEPREEQQPWVELLKNGFMTTFSSTDVPVSWMYQAEWTKLLERASEAPDAYNWYTWLHLGMIYFIERRLAEAKKALDASMRCQQSCWALYGLSQVYRLEGDMKNSALLTMKAAFMNLKDSSLAVNAMRQLLFADMPEKILQLASKLPEKVGQIGRIKLCKAFAYLKLGDIDKAEELLYEGGGIVVPDIREGENTVTELWFSIEEAKAVKEGRTFNREEAKPPAHLDFRMKVSD